MLAAGPRILRTQTRHACGTATQCVKERACANDPARVCAQQARAQLAARALSSKAQRTENEDATSWRGKGHLDCGESTGCIECIRALGRDAVQVERQRDARAGNGDAFRQLQGDTSVRLSLGQCVWMSYRHNINKSWH